MVPFELDEHTRRAGNAARLLAGLLLVTTLLASYEAAARGPGNPGGSPWLVWALIGALYAAPAVACLVLANRVEARRDWAGVALIVVAGLVATVAAGLFVTTFRANSHSPLVCCAALLPLATCATAALLIVRAGRGLSALKAFRAARGPTGFEPVMPAPPFGEPRALVAPDAGHRSSQGRDDPG